LNGILLSLINLLLPYQAPRLNHNPLFLLHLILFHFLRAGIINARRLDNRFAGILTATYM
jgi:hypothetical protein